MDKFILGLDMGANSLGWAIIENNDGGLAGLTACGSRVFQEAVDAKTRTPKNKARRDARSARKTLARRKMRRNKLLNLLVQKKLLPEDAAGRELLFADNKSYDPYILRKQSLDRGLDPYELGRVLYHLCQRRGFQSNRKAPSKDDGKIRGEIATLRADMEASGARTLGEYLAGLPKKRGVHTDRAMYQEEFEKIWQAQKGHHPDILITAFKVAVHNAIFFQRPLNLQKNLVGKCTFEPGRKRAARALLEAQRFRMLQDINHLAVKNPKTRNYRPLAPEERQALIGLLNKQKTLKWSSARKKLGLHEGEVFNLEEGKKTQLIGNRTACTLRSMLGERWEEMTPDEQKSLVTDMLTIDSEAGFLNRMRSHWKFGDKTAEELAKTELEQGYMRLSLKAIRTILPFLEEGMTYSDACKAAGYDHSNTGAQDAADALGLPPYLRNPVVQKALYEARKVVNAVIRRYGKPAVIRVEMARDMKLTRKQKDDSQKRNIVNRKENEKAKDILQKEFGIQNPEREDVQKYRMWEECGAICPYTGKSISREMLFSPEVDVEHILPYSRTLDDSYMNKTLCLATENRKIKHNRTPYEAYGVDEKRYGDILLRVKNLPWPKRRKFEQKEVDTDKFIERQLNDTRYICREVKKYLEGLGLPVEISKGEATAALRRKWGLDRILSQDGGMGKNREDHRQHAVDAVVIALTGRPLFQKLSRLSAQNGEPLSSRGFYLEAPWPSFYKDTEEKAKGILVSHSPSRKISDALHKDTAYGPVKDGEAEKDYAYFVYRKPLSGITAAMVENIRDCKVRELAVKRLEESGGDLKKAFGNPGNPLRHVDGKTPIKSVRIAVKANKASMFAIKKDGRPYKFFALENNHHVEIVENMKTERWEGKFVTAMEAARRARMDKKAVINRDHGPEYRFVMSLCINDMVEAAINGRKHHYRVQLLDGSNQNITFRLHSASTLTESSARLIKRPSMLKALECRKIAVSPLGDFYYCND